MFARSLHVYICNDISAFRFRNDQCPTVVYIFFLHANSFLTSNSSKLVSPFSTLAVEGAVPVSDGPGHTEDLSMQLPAGLEQMCP